MSTRHIAAAALVAGTLVSVLGCHRKPAPQISVAPVKVVGSKSATPAPAPLTNDQVAQFQPNEAGLVPILEYHSIDTVRRPKDPYSRYVDDFKKDLNRLYTEGYRPISLSEYLNNRITAALGKSPVVFTFDDARGSQFKYLPDGSIDPNCAIGVYQEFTRTHPDFPMRGTFYILPRTGFEQPSDAAKKMQALLTMGFELGNHTITHPNLRKLSDEKVRWEIATCVAEIKRMAPSAVVDTLALPMGISPRKDKAQNLALLASGESGGEKYTNRAVLMVGAEPARCPESPKFDPMRLPRVQAVEGMSGITFHLDNLKAHPKLRYVSDGDPNTVTIPKSIESRIDKTKLQGANLRVY